MMVKYKIVLFAFLMSFSSCYSQIDDFWCVDYIKDINLKFAFPSDFVECSLGEVVDLKRINWRSDINYIYQSVDTKRLIDIKFEDYSNWIEPFNYDQVGFYYSAFYHDISDSIKIVGSTKNIKLIDENKFNQLELIYSERKRSDFFYLLILSGRTNKGYEVVIKYQVLYDENIEEYIKEAQEIIERLEFVK